ncbi:hypothetical protein [Ruegeria sp. A3M17]|uniref:hypothetical protein n=1 Tax=Ruegeria sp. A3M17 TaxID=2267229 RepID=UPI000DEBD760|nr:hypothetical protein [Ruegeria sp. A3M17]RBW57736.1 hypothetical protein DS906_10485 [Ruegeria sp. A3M17]
MDYWRSLSLFAHQYLSAVHILTSVSDPSDQPDAFAVGPVYNTLGLATELALKATLSKELGFRKEKLKRLGHDLHALYVACDKAFDREEFERDVFVWAGTSLDIPQSAQNHYSDLGLSEKTYLHFSIQLAALNYNYFSEPNTLERFATRYPNDTLTAREVRVQIITYGLERILCRLH